MRSGRRASRFRCIVSWTRRGTASVSAKMSAKMRTWARRGRQRRAPGLQAVVQRHGHRGAAEQNLAYQPVQRARRRSHRAEGLGRTRGATEAAGRPAVRRAVVRHDPETPRGERRRPSASALPGLPRPSASTTSGPCPHSHPASSPPSHRMLERRPLRRNASYRGRTWWRGRDTSGSLPGGGAPLGRAGRRSGSGTKGPEAGGRAGHRRSIAVAWRKPGWRGPDERLRRPSVIQLPAAGLPRVRSDLHKRYVTLDVPARASRPAGSAGILVLLRPEPTAPILHGSPT